MIWSDKPGPRDRRAWLLLIDQDGRVHVFGGKTIPGVVAVVGHDYTKNGKWSHTTYRLQLAPGVRAIAGRDGWETGRFVEGLRDAARAPAPIDRWADVANAIGVTLQEAMRFLRAWRPKAAEALDRVEADLASVDEAAEEGADVIAVTFGSPTNRLLSQGFWSWPVRIVVDGQEVGRLVPQDGTYIASGQVRVLALERAYGYHGGHVSMRLAVPAGAKAHHGEEG